VSKVIVIKKRWELLTLGHREGMAWGEIIGLSEDASGVSSIFLIQQSGKEKRDPEGAFPDIKDPTKG